VRQYANLNDYEFLLFPGQVNYIGDIYIFGDRSQRNFGILPQIEKIENKPKSIEKFVNLIPRVAKVRFRSVEIKRVSPLGSPFGCSAC